MKITKIDVFKVKTDRPLWRPVFCRVYTDEGIYGDGEAAVAYGRAAEGGFGALKEFAGLVIGEDPLKNEVIWEKLYRSTFWLQNGGPIVMAALSALDMAFWDIKGKYYKAPIHELLGGAMRTTLRSYASQLQNGWNLNDKDYQWQFSPEDFANAAKKAVADGYDAVKYDFFEQRPNRTSFTREDRRSFVHPKDLAILEDRLAAVREAVGPDVDIIAEAHSRMDLPGAVRYAKILEKYDVMFFEEPNNPTPYMTKTIADQVNIPIAFGERLYTRYQFVPYFENGSIQLAQPDLGNCGGFTEVKKVCDMACAYDVGIQIHVCASFLSTAASLHMEAVIPNFTIHEHHVANLLNFNQGWTTNEYQPVNGAYELPTGYGIGTEISEKAFRCADAFAEIK